MQGRLQLPNLAFRAFYHPSPPKQMARWNHKISLPSGTKLPQTPRFNQLWKRYESLRLSYEAIAEAALLSPRTVGRAVRRLAGLGLITIQGDSVYEITPLVKVAR